MGIEDDRARRSAYGSGLLLRADLAGPGRFLAPLMRFTAPGAEAPYREG